MTFVEALERAAKQVAGVHVTATYSGRGMYSRKCPSISGDFNDCQRAIAMAIQNAAADLVNAAQKGNIEGAHREFEKFTDSIMQYSSDQLGLGVVLYWPME